MAIASRSMRPVQISLSALTLAVAAVAVIAAIVRWGIGLPPGPANGLIRVIVIGVAPMASLLGLGFLLTLRDWSGRGECRSFWLGFLVCGSIAVIAYVC